MRLFANCKVAMSTVVALCLLITNIEAAAFAQAQPSTAPPVSAAPENQSPPPPSAQSEQSEAKPRAGRRKLKWLLIGAAFVGGVAAAILIKNRKGPEPVVTVGGPSIGSPQ